MALPDFETSSTFTQATQFEAFPYIRQTGHTKRLDEIDIGRYDLSRFSLKRGESVEVIRPSSDLRNHYNEISKQCRESKTAVIITVNGRGDTAVLGLQHYNQMKAELNLLRTLSAAEEDVKSGRVAPVQDSFDQLRATLLDRKKADV